MWDEELNPVLQWTHASDFLGSRLPAVFSFATESVLSDPFKIADMGVTISSIALSIKQMRRWLGAGFIMTSRILQAVDRPGVGDDGSHTRIHGAGIKPNTMDHFMQSNPREVLFVI